jgi:signal transduction histidine kinase
MNQLARQVVNEPSPAEQPAPKVPGAILVVEDEPEILEPLCHALKRAGYVVFAAEDGLTACRMLGSQRPDLVLLDIMLPDLDGWEVCRMLRQHPDRQIATTPVIMLTALNSPEDKLHGLTLGADGYLPKPYSQQEVLLLGAKLIERHRREVALEKRFAQLNRVVEQQHDLHALLFHELRNQLGILQLNADLLRHAGGSAADRQLAAVQRSSDYLQCLAEDFLLIREVQGGGLQLPAEPLVVAELIAELLGLYAAAAHARGITLHLRDEGAPRPLSTNRPALKIILSALLDNAIKYGPAGCPVEVVCRFGDWRLELEVRDEGVGIPAGDRERVFERFYRRNPSGGIDGSGLGLFGVRVLANALGGDAEIDAQHGAGNCFHVWLPLPGDC